MGLLYVRHMKNVSVHVVGDSYTIFQAIISFLTASLSPAFKDLATTKNEFSFCFQERKFFTFNEITWTRCRYSANYVSLFVNHTQNGIF